MSRILGTCTVMFLAVTPFALAQNPPPTTLPSLEVTVSVHDYADAPAPLLTAAEVQASRIFRRAGLETVWLNCGPKVEDVEPKACYTVDATHLILKILPHALSAQVRNRTEVLGAALLDEQGTGYYAYAFYDRVRQLAEDRSLGYAILGDVLAHEIGHLLLGSNSHSVSGIMCAHWNDKELRSISEGAMTFVPAQSEMIQDRLRACQSERIDLVPFAKQQESSASASALPRDEHLTVSEK